MKNFSRALIQRRDDATSSPFAVRGVVSQIGKAFALTGTGLSLPRRIDPIPTGAAAVFRF